MTPNGQYAASIKWILVELATADTNRRMRDAPAPNKLTAKTVSSTISILRNLLQPVGDDLTDGSEMGKEYDTESAYAATSDSKSSTKTHYQQWKREKEDKKKEKKKKKTKKEKKKKLSSSDGNSV